MLLCNEAAGLLSCDEWAARPDLAERLARYCRRAYLGTLITRQLAPEGDLPYQDEQLGVLAHEALQNAPPVFDQLRRVRPCCTWTSEASRHERWRHCLRFVRIIHRSECLGMMGQARRLQGIRPCFKGQSRCQALS